MSQSSSMRTAYSEQEPIGTYRKARREVEAAPTAAAGLLFGLSQQVAQLARVEVDDAGVLADLEGGRDDLAGELDAACPRGVVLVDVDDLELVAHVAEPADGGVAFAAPRAAVHDDSRLVGQLRAPS